MIKIAWQYNDFDHRGQANVNQQQTSANELVRER